MSMTKFIGVIALLFIAISPAYSQCDPGNGIGGTGPDVMVGDLTGPANHGSAGSYVAYSVGTTSCNIGTDTLEWISNTNRHPVISGHLFRLKDNRFEQVGLSWLKHGFLALAGNICSCTCNNPGTGSLLGIGCSDPYSASLNGSQGSLGARSEVGDPANGLFTYPRILNPATADTTSKRIRVPVSDMQPAQNPGATYFLEGQYISFDDAQSGNAHNNCSYRQVSVNGSMNLSFVGSTQRQLQAIRAWKTADPSVTLVEHVDADNGLMILGYKVTDNLDGTYSYEYAMYNMNSTRAASAFRVPIQSGLTPSDVDFHAPEYHSGEQIDNTPWNFNNASTELSWELAGGSNKWLRWGSLYNFRFVAGAPPEMGNITVDYNSGATADFQIAAMVPSGNFLAGVENLSCNDVNQTVELNWTNPISYTSIEVERDGVVIASLAGSATSYVDNAPLAGNHEYRVYASDGPMSSGGVLCVANFPNPISVTLVGVLPMLLDPAGDFVDVEIQALNGASLDLGSLSMSYNEDGGVNQNVGLVSQGANIYRGNFAALNCGSLVSFNFSAATTSGYTAAAPSTGNYEVLSALGATQTLDDMEANSGWSFGAVGDDATTGIWVRIDPIGTAAQPENDTTPTGTFCWATGQQPAGNGNIGANDVDGGKTSLNSPVYDMSAMNNPSIGYNRWYSNDAGASPNDDTFLIEITNNGTDWVQVELIGPAGAGTSGGWIYHEFIVTDFVSLSSTVQMRFVASDEAPGSIVEAAIDDFSVNDVICTPPPVGPDFVRGDCNSDSSIDLSDPISMLGFMFAGGTLVQCEDSCDINDDGALNIADSVLLLAYVFQGGANPQSPFPNCGQDTTLSMLSCAGFSACP